MSTKIEVNFFTNLKSQLKKMFTCGKLKHESYLTHTTDMHEYNCSQHMRSRLQLFVNASNAMKKVWNMLVKPWQYYDQHMEDLSVLAAFSCRNVASQYICTFVYSKTEFWCSLLQSVTYYLIETQSELKNLGPRKTQTNQKAITDEILVSWNRCFVRRF